MRISGRFNDTLFLPPTTDLTRHGNFMITVNIKFALGGHLLTQVRELCRIH